MKKRHSIILGVLGSVAIGATVAVFTGRSKILRALRQLGIAAVAAGVTCLARDPGRSMAARSDRPQCSSWWSA